MKKAFCLLLLYAVPVWAQGGASQETNVYAYITPIALFFLGLEMFLCWLYRRDYISFPEAVANLGTALGNQTVNVLVAAGVYVAYGYLWANYRLMTLEMNVLNFILLLLGIDFIFYWVHRWGHAFNIMWAAHSPHHSAEEMNFFVALRASVTQRVTSFLFFWPLALIGFKPLHIYAIAGVHLFIAFLHHTEFIGKLGWFEKYFTTPSHHRVHHGVNFPYLDKNFGEFLIIWDKLFGTFAEEREKVVYGIYNHPKSWNPLRINFHYYIVLWRDAVAAPYWWDKIRIWFMPSGWRPRGLPAKEMVEITPANQIRYRPPMFAYAKPYLIFNILTALALMMMVIKANSSWSGGARWVGALLLWHQIVNWGGMLEAKAWVWFSEMARIVATTAAVIIFSRLYEPSPALAVILATAFFSLVWTSLYLRPQSPKLATMKTA